MTSYTRSKVLPWKRGEKRKEISYIENTIVNKLIMNIFFKYKGHILRQYMRIKVVHKI